MNILLMILILLGLCIGSSNDLHMIGENKITLTLSNQLEHSKLLKRFVTYDASWSKALKATCKWILLEKMRSEPFLKNGPGLSIASQLAAIVRFDAEGRLIQGTGLQLPGVLDEFFSHDDPLGAPGESIRETIMTLVQRTIRL
ncbi:hypothetical protein YC2023_124572 [Brassica napus]